MLFRKSLTCAIVLSTMIALSGCPCGGPGVLAILSPIDNVTGWVILGDWGFSGILSNFTDDADDQWQFQGSLQFPTTGYSMAAPEITISESNPEHVSVRLLVIPPAAGVAAETRAQEIKFTLQFDVSEDATFDFQVVTACNGQEGDCGGDGELADKYSLDDVPGYSVRGDNNFIGFLIYNPIDEAWQLLGSFVFLTGGHTAELVDVTSSGTPTTTTITLRVTPPARGAAVAQFIQTIPIEVTIDTSVSTLFRVVIETACPD